MNYEQMPSRGKSTSTGVAASEHGECRGRCYVHYDENRFYRVECEHCGDVFKFTADSLDQAIERWNIIVDAGAGQKDEEKEVGLDCYSGLRAGLLTPIPELSSDTDKYYLGLQRYPHVKCDLLLCQAKGEDRYEWAVCIGRTFITFAESVADEGNILHVKQV